MSLTLTRADLEDEVGRALGYGRGSLSGDLQEDVTVCIERGLRQFYTPEPLQGERTSHRWSFLRTVESLTTIAPNLATTVTVSHGSPNITLAASMDSTVTVDSISHVSITAADGSVAKYLVQTVTNTRELVLSSNYLEGSVSAVSRSITVHYNGTYALPSAFAGIDGPMTYDTFFGTDPNVADQTIEITSEAKLRDMFQYLEDRDDKPRVAAIFQTGATGTAGSSARIAFYPIPDAVYRLKYTQINEPANITSGSHVPLGGTLHSETILASCLAIAEQFFIPQSPHGYQASYRRRLAASIELDRQAMRSETLGYNADPSEFASLTGFTDARLSRYLHDNRVTVNGVQY